MRRRDFITLLGAAARRTRSSLRNCIASFGLPPNPSLTHSWMDFARDYASGATSREGTLSLNFATHLETPMHFAR
jgi:hypothetical protein